MLDQRVSRFGSGAFALAHGGASPTYFGVGLATPVGLADDTAARPSWIRCGFNTDAYGVTTEHLRRGSGVAESILSLLTLLISRRVVQQFAGSY
jgi:hypothetical protein